MGIDRESDVAANLQIGPTTLGMVRLFIETAEIELPLDFDPDEAEEIAEELRAAAARARVMHGARRGKRKPGDTDQPRGSEAPDTEVAPKATAGASGPDRAKAAAGRRRRGRSAG